MRQSLFMLGKGRFASVEPWGERARVPAGHTYQGASRLRKYPDKNRMRQSLFKLESPG
jgi:hypothetical protein